MFSYFKAIAAQFKALSKDEQGLSMVEYAVAGGLIAAAAVGAFTTLGNAVVNKIGNISSAIGG